jgi:23S rRNA pseudouridine1911/1915/1917 synthase
MKLFGNAEIPDVIFCDNHLLIAAKPCGWLTQPNGEGCPDLESFAKAWVKREFNKPGAVFLHCIHRLDRPVSGLVLFAKTSKALSRLNELSRDGGIKRLYVAEVEGILPHKTGTLEHFLIHGEHRALIARESDKDAKKAILDYVVVTFKEHSTLVKIDLQTGRYHQIRAQFGAIGHPVLGDAKYGGSEDFGDTVHLSCTDLKFTHPVTQEMIDFHCEAPFA